MSIFNFLKKKDQKSEKPECACACGCSSSEETQKPVDYGASEGGVFSVKVLGSGCKSCHELFENTKQAAENVGISAEVEYITDMQEVMKYGVMSMPALVVNDKVASAGRVLKTAEIEKLLGK